jgi:uncharacterized protein involved in exopolysaccharide biosynthesis
MADIITKSGHDALVLAGNNTSATSWQTRDLISTAFRHKRTLVACFFGINLLAMAIAVIRPREYESEAKVLVKHERADPLVTAGAQQLELPERTVSAEEINSEIELIRGDDLLRRVVLACGLAEPSTDLRKSERNIALAVARLRSRLKSAVVRKTNVLLISYRSRSPEQSAAVLKAILGSYLDKHIAAHSVSNELEFFDQQVDHYRQELAKAEQDLARFSQKDGTVSPAMQRDAVLQRQNEFNASLQQTYSAIAETQERIRTLKKEADSTPARVTTQLRNADNPQLLQDLKATLLRLELKRTDLLSKFQPNYPPVEEVEQEIENTKAALSSSESSPLRDKTTDVNPIRQWIDSELKKAEAELASLQSRAYKTTGIVQAYDRQARSLDEQQLRHEELQRNAKSAEDNYLLYVRKREDARITSAMDQRRILNLTVIEPVIRPALPITTSRSYFVLFGIIVAAASTAGLLLILQHIDDTFRTPRQLEETLQIPVLATVPSEHRLSSNPKLAGISQVR